MATWHIFRCSKCGFEIQTSKSGRYMLMSGEYQNYLCTKCKSIQSFKVDSKNHPVEELVCPECNSKELSKWNPKKGKCPKCQGEMELDPDMVIMAD